MKAFTIRWFGIGLALLTLFGVGIVIHAQDSTELPPTVVTLGELKIEVGESATLAAMIECPDEGCNGVDLVLRYDPVVIRVNAIRPGTLLVGDGKTDPIFYDNDAVNGQVHFVYFLLPGDETPQTDAPDTFIELDVTGLSVGGALIQIESITVTDSLPNDNATIGVPGYIDVRDPSQAAQFRVLNAIPLRAMPAQDGAIVGKIEAGETGLILGLSEDGAWLYIKGDASGLDGWIAFNTEAVSVNRIQLVPVIVPLTPTVAGSPIPAPTATSSATATVTLIPTPLLPPSATPISTVDMVRTAVSSTMTALAPSATVTPSNTPVPSNTPTPVPTDTPTPTATSSGVVQPRVPEDVRQLCAAGQTRFVSLPEGVSQLWVRDRPTGKTVLVILANNDPVLILNSNPRFSSKQWWCNIQTNFGVAGWVEASSLR